MIVVRFKVRAKTERSEELRAAFAAVVEPSRSLAGTLHFDIARDVTDPDVFIATEVFEDGDALDRQESLPEVQATISLLPDVLAAEPEATIYRVSASEPWG